MAVGGYVGAWISSGIVSSASQSTTIIDKDSFQVDGKVYQYVRPSTDDTHVCVKQGQSATD